MRSSRRTSKVFPTVVFALLGSFLAGCPHAPTGSKTKTSNTSEPTTLNTLLRWTTGSSENKGDSPTPSAVVKNNPPPDFDPSKKKPKGSTKPSGASTDIPQVQALSKCIYATSVLPTSWENNRIFVAGNGRLSWLDTTTQGQTWVESVKELNSEMVIERLLAYRIVGQGIEILVKASMNGAADRYVLEVQGTKITGMHAWSLPYERAEELLSTHRVPRCKPDGTMCLRAEYSHDPAGIWHWSMRDGTDEIVEPMVGVKDVAWSSDGANTIVLTDCGPGEKPSP